MKINYIKRWCYETGTCYTITFRITEEENNKIFNGKYDKGLNFGNAYTINYVAHDLRKYIENHPEKATEYKKQMGRLVVGNGCVFVGNGAIPDYAYLNGQPVYNF